MGKIAVHEFITLDGVIEAPKWTFDYPFDPRCGQCSPTVWWTSCTCSSFPLALGAGEKLFADVGSPIKLTLGGADAYDSGVVHLTYRPTT